MTSPRSLSSAFQTHDGLRAASHERFSCGNRERNVPPRATARPTAIGAAGRMGAKSSVAGTTGGMKRSANGRGRETARRDIVGVNGADGIGSTLTACRAATAETVSKQSCAGGGFVSQSSDGNNFQFACTEDTRPPPPRQITENFDSARSSNVNLIVLIRFNNKPSLL